MEDKIVVNGKLYKLVTIRDRSKYIAIDGDAINPYRRNQKCSIHYNADGYPCFGGGIPIHLYVAYAWVDGYFEGAEVNHKDFNRNNYNVSNLEWVTHKENIEYTIKNNYNKFCEGKYGEKNGRARFTENEVIKIRELYRIGYTIADIIREFYPNLQTQKQYRNIHSTFANIVHNKTWKHLL